MRDDAPSVGHPSLATSSSGQLPPGMHVCLTQSLLMMACILFSFTSATGMLAHLRGSVEPC